jgi:ABC-type hemin transport system ATPase subunit
MAVHANEQEARAAAAEQALRPFVDSWDFHAADYLAELVDGEEQRILPARVVADIIEAQKRAREALGAQRQEGDADEIESSRKKGAKPT